MSGGQQIDVGQGNVVYSLGDVSDSLVGSASTSDAGTQAPSASVRLRSRKTGGGAASFLLTGQFSTGQHTAPAPQVAALLSSPTVNASRGSFGVSRTRALSGTSVLGLQTTIGPAPSSDWNTGDFAFTEGVADSYQLLVPSGYTSGGRFFVNSGTLPASITLSDTGLLEYSGAAGLSSISATFGYTEPYAFPTLSLYANKTGNYPYMSTLFANEGTVPAGRYVYSPDDSNLRGTTINTWPDGSARVIILHSRSKSVTATQTSTVNVRLAPTSFSQGTALSSSFIQTLVTSVAVNFGTLQTLDLSTATPHRVWWANSECICARYVLSCGLGVMEAQIDIHAFASGYAFVEVVVENSKVDFSLTTPPALPGPSRQTYTNATIAVNGTTIATVNPPVQGTYGGQPYFTTGTHEKFRAFYVGAWVVSGVATAIRGASDPWMEVTHDKDYMQHYPIWPGANARTKTHNPTSVYLRDVPYTRPSGLANQPYTSDFYQPWDIGRFKAAYMANPGQINQLPHQDWRYIQGPDRHTARAVIASTLAYMSYYINYRDSTNDVPSFTRIGTRYRQQYIPVESGVQPDYSYYHQGGMGIMGFMCQPSPCFIELCQKKVMWDGTLRSTVPLQDGLFGGVRSAAFYIRHMNQAIHITPDGHPWRASAEDALYAQIMYIDGWRTGGECKLNVVGYSKPDRQEDQRPTSVTAPGNSGQIDPNFEVAMWQNVWLVAEVNKTVGTKLLAANASRQTDVTTLRDWMLTGAIRMVNEQAATGGWRYQCQYDPIGNRGAWPGNSDGTADFPYWNGYNHGGFATWDIKAQSYYYDYPPPNPNGDGSGTWMVDGDTGRGSGGTGTQTGAYAVYTVSSVANHPSEFDYCTATWPWYCMAAEADISGASTMWTTVHDKITNLTTWLNGFGTDLEDGIWPRNYTLDK